MVFNVVSWCVIYLCFFFFSSRRRHTRCLSDWSSDVCSSDLFDSYTAAAKVTEAQLKAAQDRVRFSEQGIATARAGAEAARARVQQTQAELAQSTAGERQVLVS